MARTDQLSAQLDRLAAFEPGPFPVVSLYLNLQPNERGRDQFDPFLRKELTDRVRTYPADAPERGSLEQDAERIRTHMESVEPSANGYALFACAAADLFEGLPLAAPIDANRLYVSDRPQLYPLARLLDEYPRYAVLLADSHSARIFVVAANRLEQETSVAGIKTHRHKMGGWSQARYQRHVDNYHLHHAKEVAETLARIVRDERPGAVILSGDVSILPLLKDHLPKEVSALVVDELNLAPSTPAHEVLEASLEAVREKDAETDRERVEALFTGYRSGGLACVGVDATLKALELGQVDELMLTARPDWMAGATSASGAPPGSGASDRSLNEQTANELVVKATQTAARVRFVEDAALLRPVGGAGAFLRFQISESEPRTRP